jgi:uncharacterized RDD family membrane protein YckC
MLIKSMTFLIGSTALATLGETGFGLILLFAFVLTWFYSVVFEVLAGGMTPGKRVFDLRVVHDDGTPVGWSAAIVRSLIGFVDWLPFGYALGLCSCLFHPSFKRLGDLAAGTVVVHARRRPATRWSGTVAAQAPPVALRREEQRAVVEFAERSPLLTNERREELAAIVPQLSAGGGADRLLAQARWLAGDR